MTIQYIVYCTNTKGIKKPWVSFNHKGKNEALKYKKMFQDEHPRLKFTVEKKDSNRPENIILKELEEVIETLIIIQRNIREAS